MQELKITHNANKRQLTERSVTIFFEPYFTTVTGNWSWDFASDAVFCSNVMLAPPQGFEGTIGIIHPDDVEEVKTKIASGQIGHITFRIITSYGEVRNLVGDSLIILAQQTELPNHDEDQLREQAKISAERKELASLLLFKEVQERADRFHHSGIWWYNESTNETWYSAEVFRIYDVAPFSLKPHLNIFLPFIHPEDREVEEYFDRSYKEKTPLHIEYRIQTSRGEKYVRYLSQWMFSANGQPVLSGILEDITNEKNKERELEEFAQTAIFLKQQLLFDEDSDAIGHWTLNLVTRKFVFSANFPRLFGLKSKSVVEISGLNEYIHPEDKEAYKMAMKKMLLEHKVPEMDFRIYRGDGKLRYMSQKAKLLTDANELVVIATVQDITVETLLKKKIKEFSDEEAVRSFAQGHSEETAAMAGWVWNTRDNHIKWSENFHSMLGLKSNAREITHKFFLSFIHLEDQKMFNDQMNLLMNQKLENSFNFRMQLWGRTKYMKASFRLMKHEENELFVAAFRDVTKEHLMEEELKETVQLAEALSENISDRVIITDIHHSIKIWNKACEEAYGKDTDEVKSKNFFDVFPDLKTEEQIALFNRVLKGERIFLKGNRSSHTGRHNDVHLLPVWDNEHTEVSGIIHILRDVTGELQLRHALNERLNFIESLVESSPDLIIALDRNMNYLAWNKKCEEFYGLKKEQVIGKNVLEVFPFGHHLAYEHFRAVLKGQTIHLPATAEQNGHELYLLPVKNEKQEIQAVLWIEHDLSKEFESERQLKQQGQLMEAVFNAFVDGIILFKALSDEKGTITDYKVLLNNAVSQKWNVEEPEGEKEIEVFPSIKTMGLFDAYNNVMQTGEPFDEEVYHKWNGSGKWFRIRAVKLDDDQLVTTAEDITARKKMEAELRESRHYLEQTTKTSPDSISIYDLRKKLPVYLNNCFAEWTGISIHELVNMGVEGRLQLIHPDDRLKLLQFNEKIATVNDGDIFTMEYRVRTANSQWTWLRNRSKVFQRDDKGNVTHLLSVLQNVNEEIELREELKRRSQLAEAVLENSSNRITVFDSSYRFIVWNKRCEELLGIAKDKVIGKTIFEIFPGVENYPALMDAQERSLKGEVVHLPPLQDGYTGSYLELFYVPLKNENGETYAVMNVMIDVSKYVKNTEELDALNKKLESKNAELEKKNDEISNFAFVASHDMKEPLRKIHTFSDWLVEQEGEWLSSRGKSIVEKINASVLRMEILLEDILILSKIHSDRYRYEDADLNKILKQAMEDMSEQIEQTATIIHTHELPILKANASQLLYLFKNLMSNAIKFQKPGGVPEITITAEVVKGCEVDADNRCEEYLKLSFTDNGFGFDQRYAKKIFRVFQRLHGEHEFEGTGIGLAICRKIMENHEGMITVTSEIGKGSVFSCFFPLH